jgi:hypothetical protein
MVTRVWSNVDIASRNPEPGSPIIRSDGMRTLSRYTSRVGEPLTPSFRSGAPKLTPVSPFSTTNAEMPCAPAPASVTAKTV